MNFNLLSTALYYFNELFYLRFLKSVLHHVARVHMYYKYLFIYSYHYMFPQVLGCPFNIVPQEQFLTLSAEQVISCYIQ